MRLTEFAVAELYIQPANGPEHFVKQLRRLSPDRSADDLGSPVRPNRRQPLLKPRRPLDQL
jgi:hypothetical protein